jgi:hypothetical protein
MAPYVNPSALIVVTPDSWRPTTAGADVADVRGMSTMHAPLAFSKHPSVNRIKAMDLRGIHARGGKWGLCHCCPGSEI